jgi:hypothetical protein
MTDRTLTPEEIRQADRDYAQSVLHVITLGLVPPPPERELEAGL